MIERPFLEEKKLSISILLIKRSVHYKDLFLSL